MRARCERVESLAQPLRWCRSSISFFPVEFRLRLPAHVVHSTMSFYRASLAARRTCPTMIGGTFVTARRGRTAAGRPGAGLSRNFMKLSMVGVFRFFARRIAPRQSGILPGPIRDSRPKPGSQPGSSELHPFGSVFPVRSFALSSSRFHM